MRPARTTVPCCSWTLGTLTQLLFSPSRSQLIMQAEAEAESVRVSWGGSSAVERGGLWVTGRTGFVSESFATHPRLAVNSGRLACLSLQARTVMPGLHRLLASRSHSTLSPPQMRGEAEAFAIGVRARAEAEQMAKKAEAFQLYQEAAQLDMLLEKLPQVWGWCG